MRFFEECREAVAPSPLSFRQQSQRRVRQWHFHKFYCRPLRQPLKPAAKRRTIAIPCHKDRPDESLLLLCGLLPEAMLLDQPSLRPEFLQPGRGRERAGAIRSLREL